LNIAMLLSTIARNCSLVISVSVHVPELPGQVCIISQL
jgi:hypothetical protein